MGVSEDEVIESMSLPKKINVDVDISIPMTSITYDPKKYKHKCLCCGKMFNGRPKDNFLKTNSPLFQANDGFLPWCKDCIDKYMELLIALYSGNEEHAIEHFCQQVDWVYDVNPLKCTKDIRSERSRVALYATKKNLNTGGRKTYIDSIKYNYKEHENKVVETREEVKNTKREERSVSVSAVDRWGVGFSDTDYKNLDDHYRMLKRNNPNCDNNQEIFIKSLCSLNMLMNKSLREGDSDKYVKLTGQYTKTFNQAGLKTVEEKDASNDESFCMTLGFISDYTPEEFYKDKKLYEDYDKLGEYIDRHITRPMMNLQNGTDIRDSEFYVPEIEAYDD